jgi:plasmid stability protein
MPHTSKATGRRVISTQLALSADDHERLLLLAASHERSAAAEVRWVVRQWLDENVRSVAFAGQN